MVDIKIKEFGDSSKLMECINKIRKCDVLVGIPEEKSSRADEEINNAELAYIHTHGIRRRSMIDDMEIEMTSGKKYSEAYELYIQSHGSPLWHSPPRPIIEPAIEAHKDEISEFLMKALNAALDGDENGMINNLKRAGMDASNFAKDWFDDSRNKWAPNSPETIKAKTKSGRVKDKPLIETGDLRKSITYVVEEG